MKTELALAALNDLQERIRQMEESLASLEMYAEFLVNVVVENTVPLAPEDKQYEDHNYS